MSISSHDTTEGADLRSWVESQLLTEDDFTPERIGRPHLLLERLYRGSLLTMVLDGFTTERPEWSGTLNPPSEVLFRGFAAYLQNVPTHLVQLLCHDDAYWEIGQSMRLTTDVRYLPYVLSLIHREPAAESGTTILLALADDRKSALAIADGITQTPPYFSRLAVTFYGDDERWSSFMDGVKISANHSNAIQL